MRKRACVCAHGGRHRSGAVQAGEWACGVQGGRERNGVLFGCGDT